MKASPPSNLVEKIVEIFTRDYNERRYTEPFFEGSALFFHIEPKGGSINDINLRPMNFNRIVRDRPDELINEASKYRYNRTSTIHAGIGSTHLDY